jgi:hypothetical protein
VALSEDQKAMLRLLAQREQGYEDIAALMGLSVDEVRAKAKEAAAQMEAEGLPAPALPPEPEGAEEAKRPAAAPPPAPPPEPRAPEAEAPAKAPAPPPPQRESATPARPRLTLPSDPGVRGALAAAALVVVALVAILIVSGGDGDSSGEPTTAASNTASGGASDGADSVTNSQEVTKAVLEPVDGGEASGVAIFGREGKSLALQVEATGLEPPGKGESYAIWLAQSPQRMLPLAAAPVSDEGRLASQFRVPVEVLGYLANETFTQMAVTLVDNSELDAALKAATKAKESPDYTGTAVLRGEVTGPIVGAGK